MTTQTVALDQHTGLPEVPEGYFWRVGEIDQKYGTGGWSSGGRMKPGVSLMTTGYVTKYENIPIYGTRWWNKHIQVATEVREWPELAEVTVTQRLFTGWAAAPGRVPEIGIECGGMGTIHGPLTTIHYEIPVTPEGIKWIAEGIWKDFQANEKWRKQIEDEKRYVKENLYGDYPPKNLNSV